jgi:hypothetical protein
MSRDIITMMTCFKGILYSQDYMFGKKFFKVAFHRTIINTNSHMSFLAYFRETFLPLLNNITKFSLPFYGVLCYGGEQ